MPLHQLEPVDSFLSRSTVCHDLPFLFFRSLCVIDQHTRCLIDWPSVTRKALATHQSVLFSLVHFCRFITWFPPLEVFWIGNFYRGEVHRKEDEDQEDSLFDCWGGMSSTGSNPGMPPPAAPAVFNMREMRESLALAEQLAKASMTSNKSRAHQLQQLDANNNNEGEETHRTYVPPKQLLLYLVRLELHLPFDTSRRFRHARNKRKIKDFRNDTHDGCVTIIARPPKVPVTTDGCRVNSLIALIKGKVCSCISWMKLVRYELKMFLFVCGLI